MLQKQSEGAKQDLPLSPDPSDKKDTLESYLATLDKVLPPKSPDFQRSDSSQSSSTSTSNGGLEAKADDQNKPASRFAFNFY